MNKLIEEIIKSNKTKSEKEEAIGAMQEEIDFARQVINGNMQYCEKCDEYYNFKAFFTETETKEENICIYEDPINSGGNEYKRGRVCYEYEVCPKNHRKLVSRKETG